MFEKSLSGPFDIAHTNAIQNALTLIKIYKNKEFLLIE